MQENDIATIKKAILDSINHFILNELKYEDVKSGLGPFPVLYYEFNYNDMNIKLLFNSMNVVGDEYIPVPVHGMYLIDNDIWTAIINDNNLIIPHIEKLKRLTKEIYWTKLANICTKENNHGIK